MKNFISKSVILIVFSAFLGCSSDSSNSPIPPAPCVPIICKNGGTSTPDCGCNCPTGYTGTDCSTLKVPTKIVISKIRVNYFPNQNGSSNWDTSDAPDIFVKFGKGSGSTLELLYSSSVINNVLSNGGNTVYDFTPATPINITSPLLTYTISLYDYDSTSADDFMGGFLFVPNDFIYGFPTTILLKDNSKPLSFELFVTYIF